jgi:hypothetical protein
MLNSSLFDCSLSYRSSTESISYTSCMMLEYYDFESVTILMFLYTTPLTAYETLIISNAHFRISMYNLCFIDAF